jgi:hypothetical protein
MAGGVICLDSGACSSPTAMCDARRCTQARRLLVRCRGADGAPWRGLGGPAGVVAKYMRCCLGASQRRGMRPGNTVPAGVSA